MSERKITPLTPTSRLKLIAEILEQHDNELLTSGGPVPQEPQWMRRIYLLAKGKMDSKRG